MTREKEAFLDRWSRLKQEQPEEKTAVPVAKEEPLPPLQPVDELKPDSDFTPFMNPKVDHKTRRSALKKLFTDAHYNVPDPFEAYCEDYTQSEPIPEKMLKAINRVRDVAVRGQEQVAEEKEPAQAEAPTQEADDVPGKQDA